MRHSPQSFEPVVAALLKESWLARQLRNVARAGETALRASRATPVATEWISRVRVDAGLGLIVAAAIHVALLLIDGMPAGWLWLVPPVAAAAGGALLRLSRRQSSEPSA